MISDEHLIFRVKGCTIIDDTMNPSNPFDSIATAQELAVLIQPICEQIYRQIGPDRHESEYQEHLCHYLSRYVRVLTETGFYHEASHGIFLHYKADIVILIRDRIFILELKTVVNIDRLHHEQLERYIGILNATDGLIINFAKRSRNRSCRGLQIQLRTDHPDEEDGEEEDVVKLEMIAMKDRIEQLEKVIKEMQKDVQKAVAAKQTKLEQVKKGKPLTKDIVDDQLRIGRYTREMFLNRSEGIAKFFTPLVRQDDAFSCVKLGESSRDIIHRLNEEEQWVKEDTPKRSLIYSMLKTFSMVAANHEETLRKEGAPIRDEQRVWVDKLKTEKGRDDVIRDVYNHLFSVWRP